jgi:hypothetical protein
VPSSGSYGRVREAATSEQFKLKNLKFFNPVAQKQYKQSPASIITQEEFKNYNQNGSTQLKLDGP